MNSKQQLIELQTYKSDKESVWYTQCRKHGKFVGTGFICKICHETIIYYKKTLIDHFGNGCLTNEEQRSIVLALGVSGDTTKRTTQWALKLKRPPLQFDLFPRKDNKDLVDKYFTSIPKVKSISASSKAAFGIWKVVAQQHGSFSLMAQSDVQKSKRRYWFTCRRCQLSMTENKTGVLHHLMKSCPHSNMLLKQIIKSKLIAYGDHTDAVTKFSITNNTPTTRKSVAGILRGPRMGYAPVNHPYLGWSHKMNKMVTLLNQS